MLSDAKLQIRKRPKRRAVGESAAHCAWSDGQKLEAVQTYILLGGNQRQTAHVLGIPINTMQLWRKTEWWHDLESEIKQQENLTLSVRLKKIVDKSLMLVEDRLENGDFIYDQKTGQLKRKPVILKDAHQVAIQMIDKRDKLDVTRVYTVDQENIQEKLTKLAKAFEEFAGKPKTIEVTDVVFGRELTEN